MSGWKPITFSEEAKVQRSCLTVTGEARLWYETLRPKIKQVAALLNYGEPQIFRVI